MAAATITDADRPRVSRWQLHLRERVRVARVERRLPKPRGLLDPRCPWKDDAIAVSIAAPTGFGKLSDIYLRAQHVLAEHDRMWMPASRARRSSCSIARARSLGDGTPRDTVIALAGGAAGACVSVLLHRIENLSIEAVDAGMARYRIFLGLAFAAAVVFLVKGGILAAVVNDPRRPLTGRRMQRRPGSRHPWSHHLDDRRGTPRRKRSVLLLLNGVQVLDPDTPP